MTNDVIERVDLRLIRLHCVNKTLNYVSMAVGMIAIVVWLIIRYSNKISYYHEA